MITFKTFLKEHSPVINGLADIKAHILKTSSEYISATHPGDLLYRGADVEDPLSMIKKPLTQRVPVDSKGAWHIIYNYIGQEYLGIPNWRSNAYFCTPSVNIASMYGATNIVYPGRAAADTHWSASTKYPDLTGSFQENAVEKIVKQYLPNLAAHFDENEWIMAVAKNISRGTIKSSYMDRDTMNVLDCVGTDFADNYLISTGQPLHNMFHLKKSELICSNGTEYAMINLWAIADKFGAEIVKMLGIELDPRSESGLERLALTLDKYIRS